MLTERVWLVLLIEGAHKLTPRSCSCSAHERRLRSQHRAFNHFLTFPHPLRPNQPSTTVCRLFLTESEPRPIRPLFLSASESSYVPGTSNNFLLKFIPLKSFVLSFSTSSLVNPFVIMGSAPKDSIKICCIGAGYVGGPTMAVIAKKCPDISVNVCYLPPIDLFSAQN